MMTVTMRTVQVREFFLTVGYRCDDLFQMSHLCYTNKPQQNGEEEVEEAVDEVKEAVEEVQEEAVEEDEGDGGRR